MTSYVIETGIPLPPPRRGYNQRPIVGPQTEIGRMLDLLEVGQSLLAQSPADVKRVHNFRRVVEGKVFAVRKQRGGWRVWRTE